MWVTYPVAERKSVKSLVNGLKIDFLFMGRSFLAGIGLTIEHFGSLLFAHGSENWACVRYRNNILRFFLKGYVFSDWG